MMVLTPSEGRKWDKIACTCPGTEITCPRVDSEYRVLPPVRKNSSVLRSRGHARIVRPAFAAFALGNATSAEELRSRGQTKPQSLLKQGLDLAAMAQVPRGAYTHDGPSHCRSRGIFSRGHAAERARRPRRHPPGMKSRGEWTTAFVRLPCDPYRIVPFRQECRTDHRP